MFKPKPSLKQHLNLMKNNDFLEDRLRGENVGAFKELISKIALTVQFNLKYQKEKVTLGQRLMAMLSVIDSTYVKNSLTKTFKKLAIIHVLIRTGIENGYFDEEFQEMAVRELERIKNEDFQVLTREKSTNRGIEQICSFFKDLRKRGSDSRSIERQASKGVINEIVQKIYSPFYVYLLRILQDHQIYSQILEKRELSSPELLWKMINMSKHLGSIVFQLNRICRYFRRELEGILSHFMFIISLDISVYYNHLREYISDECMRCRQFINHLEEDHQLYSKKREEILSNSHFIEVRRFIEQLSLIREDLIWIYLNKELKECLKFFPRPTNGIAIQSNPQLNHITFIQSFIEKSLNPHMSRQKRRRTSIQSLIIPSSSKNMSKDSDLTEITTGPSLSESQSDEEGLDES